MTVIAQSSAQLDMHKVLASPLGSL